MTTRKMFRSILLFLLLLIKGQNETTLKKAHITSSKINSFATCIHTLIKPQVYNYATFRITSRYIVNWQHNRKKYIGIIASCKCTMLHVLISKLFFQSLLFVRPETGLHTSEHCIRGVIIMKRNIHQASWFCIWLRLFMIVSHHSWDSSWLWRFLLVLGE